MGARSGSAAHSLALDQPARTYRAEAQQQNWPPDQHCGHAVARVQSTCDVERAAIATNATENSHTTSTRGSPRWPLCAGVPQAPILGRRSAGAWSAQSAVDFLLPFSLLPAAIAVLTLPWLVPYPTSRSVGFTPWRPRLRRPPTRVQPAAASHAFFRIIRSFSGACQGAGWRRWR